MKPKEFKETRIKFGYSQTEFGKKLGGYSLNAVCAWENGKRKIPSGVKKLIAIINKVME